jgi:serine/threonine-protein kinase
MALPSGTVLRQYEIVEPLGAGAMGEVYRARDTRLGREVAIKVLPPHLAGDEYMRSRFEREARAVAALSHPNLLAIHEFTLAHDTPFAVMELLEGATLRQQLAAGPIPWRRALEVVGLVADGLAAAHAKGIVHRDLKPDNIFITSAGAVKVLDFGLATQPTLSRSTATDHPTLASTLPGLVLGTIGYMSPEQLEGHPPDARADIFSLGCVLYESLACRLPFGGTTPQEVLAATLRDPVPPLPKLQPPPPPELAGLIEHCLARSPERRFGSARDLALAIQGILQGSGPLAAAPRRRTHRSRSIAVMPLENTSGDPSAEFLADGITESIINMLSQLPGIRVVPRTMVFRYKGATFDAGAAALALNARTLLTGRLTVHGDSVTIQAELVDASTESQVWGERYRRPLSDLLALQEEIAWQISEALRMRLTGEQKKLLHKRQTGSTAAYEEYLRGRFEFNKWTAEGFRRSLDHFQRAIDLDPQYALAWCALGNSCGVLAYYGHLPSDEGFPRAERAARRALELDPALPDAHLTLALTHLFFDWDLRRSEESFQRAIALKPAHAEAHAYYAFCLQIQERCDEAVEHARRGVALDPMGTVPNMALGWTLYQAGRLEACVEHARHALSLDPAFTEAHALLSVAFEQLGEYGAAARHLPGALHVCGVPLDEASAAVAAMDCSSRERYWRTKLAWMESVGRKYPLIPGFLANAHVALGEFDAALDILEPLVPARAGYVVFMRGDPALRPLHGFPRFEALLNAAGLPRAASTPRKGSP